MAHTIKVPTTVRELGDAADQLEMGLAELLSLLDDALGRDWWNDDHGDLIISHVESPVFDPVSPDLVPEDIIVTAENGAPSFMFNMEAMQTDALALAGRVAADCDNPEVVRGHLMAVLRKLGGENADNAYTGALFMRALQYLTEDLFAPVLDIVEKTLPQHDFRQHLRAIGDDTPTAWGAGAGVA